MCRLFALSGGNQRVHATFWLLEAPDSLSSQSRREPDGTGIGWFEATGRPRVAKQPLAAYEDAAFAREAREISSTTFIAHVRYATTGDVLAQNTHPCSPHTMSYGRCATPDTHELWVLERPAGGTSGDRHLDGAGAAGTVHVRSMHLMEHGSVIVASEPLDDDSGWRLLAAGEILHVVPSLEVRSERALVGPPTHPLTLSDLEPRAASAQAPTA